MRGVRHVLVSAQSLGLTVCLLVMAVDCAGEDLPGSPMSTIQLFISGHPGRVFPGATAGLPVLQVTGMNTATGAEVRNFRFESSTDSIYFMIDRMGYIRTRTTINFGETKVFDLMVVGENDGKVGYKFVQIVVSKKNMHAPEFGSRSYMFYVYRNAVGEVFGVVSATDEDTEAYNRKVTIRPADKQASALEYVHISPKGLLTLDKEVEVDTYHLSLTIEAVDSGSPQRTGTAMVEILMEEVKQPSTFCFSTTRNSTTVCWKNPMPERRFQGYYVKIKGDDQNWHAVMPYVKGHQETCYTASGTELGSQYTVTVGISSDTPLLVPVHELVFNKSGVGYSRVCEEEGFSICNYVDPCHGHGSCRPDPRGIPGSYECDCEVGWVGKNCTFRNKCDFSTCENGGTCRYEGHDQYSCECPGGYYGESCEHYNYCLSPQNQCKNDALCLTHENGSYSCNCRVGFAGDYCERLDPCTGSTCIPGRGKCHRVSDLQFVCECFRGYYGVSCEFTDACLLNHQPCKNQGTCLTTSATDFSCLCTEEWTGPLCEQANLCAHEPCVHGYCSIDPVTGSYHCTCKPGYTGNECQIEAANPCENLVCHNGGHCEPVSDTEARCNCLPGYLPPDCLKKDPCMTSPCEHEGQCSWISDDIYNCTCVPGWLGRNCQVWDPCLTDPPVCRPGESCSASAEKDWPGPNTASYTCFLLPSIIEESPCISCHSKYSSHKL